MIMVAAQWAVVQRNGLLQQAVGMVEKVLVRLGLILKAEVEVTVRQDALSTEHEQRLVSLYGGASRGSDAYGK